MKNYIPCLQHWNEMFNQYSFFKVIKKFPVEKIKRKKLINKIDNKEVFYMLLNFNKEAWMPLTLDEQKFLIDGQHRLELAIQMGLEYVDVIIQSKSN